MKESNVQIKVFEVFADIMGIDPSKVRLSDTPETVEAWDSVRHVQLIMAAEMSFQTRLSNTEIGRLNNLQDLVELLTEKVNG